MWLPCVKGYASCVRENVINFVVVMLAEQRDVHQQCHLRLSYCLTYRVDSTCIPTNEWAVGISRYSRLLHLWVFYRKELKDSNFCVQLILKQ